MILRAVLHQHDRARHVVTRRSHPVFFSKAFGQGFGLLTINAEGPDKISEAGVTARRFDIGCDPIIRERFLGTATSAVYLVRPDHYIAARWGTFDETKLRAAMRRAIGKEG